MDKIPLSLPLILFLLLLFNEQTFAADVIQSSKHEFIVEIVNEELVNPWGMVFLPDGDILVTERGGSLRRIDHRGQLSAAVSVSPLVKEKGQGGLMDVSLHPDFSRNHRLYLSYTAKGKGGYGTEVISARYRDHGLEDSKVIFRAVKKSGGGRHFGSRLLFARDGNLFISLGDRGKKDYAQDLGDHRGSLIRLTDKGEVPADNPFVDNKKARPEIFSYGHRNMQGMALHPETGEVWTHEHGPQGGDEININLPGLNYGWPVITYGVNYFSGTSIGEGTHKKGMEQPLYKWVPSIAPSGMAFYTGTKFPHWKNNLFVGSLKFAVLVRLELEGNRVIAEERLLNGGYGRVRDVRNGPDGYLYILTNAAKGKLIRIKPGQES